MFPFKQALFIFVTDWKLEENENQRRGKESKSDLNRSFFLQHSQTCPQSSRRKLRSLSLLRLNANDEISSPTHFVPRNFSARLWIGSINSTRWLTKNLSRSTLCPFLNLCSWIKKSWMHSLWCLDHINHVTTEVVQGNFCCWNRLDKMEWLK